jgi:outer membrane protein OmpA-like peptidoglycan-associated protein
MKLFKINLVLIFLLTFAFSFAQNKTNPWVVNLGINVVSLQGDNVDANTALGIPSIGISRHIFGGLSIGAQYSRNKITGYSIPKDLKYYSLDGILKYNLSNSESFQPYLFAGFGFSAFQDGVDRSGLFPSSDVSETSLAGIGVNIGISDKMGINVSSSYRNADESKAFNHFQHVIGVTFKLGSLDSDGDGISDKNDECPEIPGLEEFAGCPDTDGDGIADKDDQCPDQAGTKDMMGCPDTDGDGIADKDDECPNSAGGSETNGCPDSDADGVADKDDECPNLVGSIETNGCPDSDGDGIPDKDDACPDNAGSIENKGCPVITDSVIDELNDEGSMIRFKASSSVIGDDSDECLEKIKSILDNYPSTNIVIEGHASSDGSKSLNQKLSEDRATSVKNALVVKGADSDRLETIGYGEDKPLKDNTSREGRKSNRRVQFSLK